MGMEVGEEQLHLTLIACVDDVRLTATINTDNGANQLQLHWPATATTCKLIITRSCTAVRAADVDVFPHTDCTRPSHTNG